MESKLVFSRFILPIGKLEEIFNENNFFGGFFFNGREAKASREVSAKSHERNAIALHLKRNPPRGKWGADARDYDIRSPIWEKTHPDPVPDLFQGQAIRMGKQSAWSG